MRKFVQLPLIILFACMLLADTGFAQIDPAVEKAQKKEEKVRQKALKKQELRQQAQLKNEENYKSSETPAKKVKVEKVKKEKKTKSAALDYGQPVSKASKEKTVKQPKEKVAKAPKEKTVKQPREKTVQQTTKTANTKASKQAAVSTKPPKEKVQKTRKEKPLKEMNNANTVVTPVARPAPPKPRPKPEPKVVKRENRCAYAFNTTDEFTGKAKVATQGQNFFTYTEEDLRKFMEPGKEYLTCNGYISSISGIKALNVEYVFDSPYAKQEYGPLHNGSNLIIKLINGTTVTLLSQEFDPGTVDMSKLRTYYTTAYLISPKDEKELMKAEVDKVRVIWDVGYEDYEVYELDFFIDQLNCIYNAE